MINYPEDTYILIGYTAFGDRIAQIPLLLKLKKQNKKVYLINYSDGRVKYSGDMNPIYNLYKDNLLFEEYIIIPYQKIKLGKFFFNLIFNLHSFNVAYAPVGTNIGKILGRLLGKNFRYTFNDNDDNSKYDNIIEGMLDGEKQPLYSYKKQLNVPYSIEYKKKYLIQSSYVTIFVGPYTGSLKPEEWINIFYTIMAQGKKIILLGGDSNEREGWIIDYIKKNDGIINLLGKTNFEELCSIISDADYTISANGGIMRLSHLLNERSISFSIMSGKILHPPVDNKLSYHIQENVCSHPCEFRVSKKVLKNQGFKKCIYYGTKKEAICRNMSAKKIIKILDFYNKNV